jgi:hypothetical protein
LTGPVHELLRAEEERKMTRRFTKRQAGLFVALVFSAAGCATSGQRARPVDLQSAYDSATRDAALYEKDHERPLRRIPPGTEAVLVVTWTTRPESYAIGTDVTTSWGDTWVTLDPEVQQSCRAFPAATRTSRLEQLLGLPPSGQDRTFVVMEAKVSDLFRPCPDPDPTASSCGPDFPPNVSPKHVDWFARQLLASLRNPNGYPWTRLGYTYDWNRQASSYGASEYVLQQGATVHVMSRYPTATYCAATP